MQCLSVKLSNYYAKLLYKNCYSNNLYKKGKLQILTKNSTCYLDDGMFWNTTLTSLTMARAYQNQPITSSIAYIISNQWEHAICGYKRQLLTMILTSWPVTSQSVFVQSLSVFTSISFLAVLISINISFIWKHYFEAWHEQSHNHIQMSSFVVTFITT